MDRTSFAVALVLGAMARPCAAAVVEVPVPGLAGVYHDEARTAAFQLPAIPTAIHGVSVRVRGTTEFATYSCDGPGGSGPPTPVPTQINVELAAEPGLWGTGRNHDAPGALDWTEPFESLDGATWSFLMDGSGEIWLSASGIHPIPECFLVGPGDSVTLESVTLLVDGEFTTPARPASWGRMKSIYR
jgi:hypothetical protein